tara:strand:+ start:1502 stop:2035 length:534 start_codon:yes stop_codon:yes gene_type:complete
MKKIILSLFVIINISSFKSISQDLKIGYTNVEYLLTFLPETKQVQSEVSAYGTQLQNQLQSKITDFQSKADVFQKSAATMTDLIRADKQEELQNLQASIQKFQAEAQTSIAQREADLFKPLFEKISNAINVVSERENFTHVFSAGGPGADVLLYAKPTDDISNLVLAELGIDPPITN